jgi:transposase-like protein
VAVGINTNGRREVLGVATGPSEAETFWKGFLRALADRGLRGVEAGHRPEPEISAILPTAAWRALGRTLWSRSRRRHREQEKQMFRPL